MPKMSVSVLTTMDYGKTPAFCRYKNKAKSKPKQSQSVAWPPWPCFHGLEAHATYAQARAAVAKQFENSSVTAERILAKKGSTIY